MLKIYFDDELLEFNEEELDYMYIDEGAEAIVYKYGNDALKVYRDIRCRRLSEKDTLSLCALSTKRILLPEKAIYGVEPKIFKGYSTPFIYAYPNVRVMDMKVNDFVGELDVIREDLVELSHNGVEVDDWHVGNMLYDGRKIYMCDPGAMTLSDRVRFNCSMGNNVYTLNRFIMDDVFPLARLSKNSKKNIETVFDDNEYIGWQIRETAEEKETVRQYVKRMTR